MKFGDTRSMFNAAFYFYFNGLGTWAILDKAQISAVGFGHWDF